MLKTLPLESSIVGLQTERSVGVPWTLITLSMELEENSGKSAGWTAIGAYAVHTRNRSSTAGTSISERLPALKRAVECELGSCQRLQVYRRSVERVNIVKYTYVVTELASQENQWEWGLRSISEVTVKAPGQSCYFGFGLVCQHIVLKKAHLNSIKIYGGKRTLVIKLQRWKKSRLVLVCEQHSCLYGSAALTQSSNNFFFFFFFLFIIMEIILSRHCVPLSHFWHLISSVTFMVHNKSHLKQFLKSWQNKASLECCPFKLSTS